MSNLENPLCYSDYCRHSERSKESFNLKFTEEFGLIPNDWEIYKLNDIVKSITSGKSYQVYSHGKYNLYGSTGIIGRTNNASYNGNYILVARVGANAGYLYKINEKCGISDNTLIIDLKENYSANFIFYILKAKNLNKFVFGSGQPLITGSQLKKLAILLPDYTEQEKIAEVLSDVDSLIDKTLGLINKKKDLKTATMQKLLTPKDDWECKTLGEIANIQRGASPRPIDSPIWFEKNSVIGWTRISDLKGKYIYSTEQKLSLLGVKNSRYVPIGSLIMSICATLGRPAITKTELCIHDGFVCFYDIKINSEYVYYYLQYIQENWKNNGQTGSQANLNTDLINNTLIPLPDNQHQIATILSDMDLEIETLEKELGKYQDLKMGMMQQLLTGQVRLLS